MGQTNGASSGCLVGSLDFSHPYFKTRGVHAETARAFEVGFSLATGPLGGRIVIPIGNARGEVVAYAGRALRDTDEPKYAVVPADFRKEVELYNLHRALAARDETRISRVAVVEGFFGCLRVHQAGFPCAVALMGSPLSEGQEVRLVENFEQVLLMLDGDDEGWQATQDCVRRLACQVFVKAVVLPSGKGPDQLSDDELRLVLSR